MVHYLLIWIDIIWIRLDWMRSDQIRCMAGGPLQFGLVPHYVADSNRGLPTSEAFSAPWYYLGTWTIRCYQETSFDTPFAELESFRDLAWPVRSRAKRFSPCGAMFGRTERSYHFSSVAELFWTQSHAPICKVCSSVRFFSKFGAHKLPGFGTLDTLSQIHFILGCWPMCTTHYLFCVCFVKKLKHIPGSFRQLRGSKHILTGLQSARALQVVRYGSIWFDQLVVQAIETSCRQCSKNRVEAYSWDAEIMCRVVPGLLQ